jgi:hypothetical protein
MVDGTVGGDVCVGMVSLSLPFFRARQSTLFSAHNCRLSPLVPLTNGRRLALTVVSISNSTIGASSNLTRPFIMVQLANE